MVMGLIVGIGIAFYFVGETVINNLYQSALAADEKLLSICGISSISGVPKSVIQSRVDEQITNYTNFLNTQSHILFSIKNDLENVENFHSFLIAFDSLSNKVYKKISLSYLRYSGKSATPLYFVQFRADNNERVLSVERKIFNNLGYKIQIEKSQTSSWYKASNDVVSILRGGK